VRLGQVGAAPSRSPADFRQLVWRPGVAGMRLPLPQGLLQLLPMLRFAETTADV
jgi:hypothetical protein